MLDLNKLERWRCKMTLSRSSPFDVDLMVRAVTMQIKSAMEKKDLHLASEVSPNKLRGVRLVRRRAEDSTGAGQLLLERRQVHFGGA